MFGNGNIDNVIWKINSIRFCTKEMVVLCSFCHKKAPTNAEIFDGVNILDLRSSDALSFL
jgi:radical SAM superfamily enzyme with C-terminal helix-hairpin-helix motif